MNESSNHADDLSEKELFPENFDAVVVAPNSHEVLFENDRVRVIRVVIQPGEKEPMHHHQWSSVMIVDVPTDLNYFDAEGRCQKIVAVKGKRKIEWMDPEPMHAVENLDEETAYDATRIEFKE